MAAGDPRPEHLAAHVRAIAGRPASETDRLTSALMGRAWPSGPADRLHPAAVQWLRRWRPQRTGGTLPPACGCHAGACAVCN